MSITYSECVFVTLGIQHAMRMLHIVDCCLPRSTIFFHIILQKTRSSKKMLLHMKCVFGLSLQHLSERFIILRRNERDMIKNVYWSSCEVPVSHVTFKEN